MERGRASEHVDPCKLKLENHIRFLVSFWGILSENKISSEGFDFRFTISQIMLYSETVIEEKQQNLGFGSNIIGIRATNTNLIEPQ